MKVPGCQPRSENLRISVAGPVIAASSTACGYGRDPAMCSMRIHKHTAQRTNSARTQPRTEIKKRSPKYTTEVRDTSLRPHFLRFLLRSGSTVSRPQRGQETPQPHPALDGTLKRRCLTAKKSGRGVTYCFSISYDELLSLGVGSRMWSSRSAEPAATSSHNLGDVPSSCAFFLIAY